MSEDRIEALKLAVDTTCRLVEAKSGLTTDVIQVAKQSAKKAGSKDSLGMVVEHYFDLYLSLLAGADR